jgi:hypothetical protein
MAAERMYQSPPVVQAVFPPDESGECSLIGAVYAKSSPVAVTGSGDATVWLSL